ncbi:hypothetical protein WJX84_003923 [Apatococcus fuscideae]|uniref:Trichohyalin-plectin-homology domain-containing protein n=1 Tax=Apatococcus fuscideae TaxID=2026836 RepID=A0AAW1T4E7_9CHLO
MSAPSLSLLGLQPGAVTNKDEERLRLKHLSQDRASRWTDTIQAQRTRRERARQDRLEALEAERQEIDRIEAEEAAERRRQQVEAANRMLFSNDDRVRALHSRLLLSEVLVERQRQMAHAAGIRALEVANEQEWLARQAIALKEAAAAEQRKLEEVKRRAMEQRDIQQQQLEDLKRRILAEREQRQLLGESIRAQALAEAKELQLKEEEMRAQARRAVEDTERANKVLQSFKQLERQREEQMDAAIQEYAKMQEVKAEDGKRREAERRAAREAQQKRLQDKMQATYLAALADQEARLARDVRLAEEKADTSAADKAAERQQEWEEIQRSRGQQLETRRRGEEEQRAADRAFADAWSMRLKELKQEERDEEQKALERNRRYANFLQHQVSRKQAKAQSALDLEFEEDLARQSTSDAPLH